MDEIILKPRSEFSSSLPEVREGDVLMHFAPHPQGKQVRYVEMNKDKFEIYSAPHWIECGLLEKGLRHDLDLINEHLDEISHYKVMEGYSCVEEKRIKKKDLDCIEHGARRLIYVLYRRLKGDRFLEVNLVGLAPESMMSMLDYALDIHDKYPAISFLFILYVDEEFLNTKESPSIIVNRESKAGVLRMIDEFYAYNWETHKRESQRPESEENVDKPVVCRWWEKLKRRLADSANMHK